MALQMDKRRRNDILIGSCIAVAIAVISFLIGAQVYGAPGDPPSNGLTSRIKTLYDSLSTLTYGSDTNSPDRGTYWNRIFTAGEWTPAGTATEADVLAGKTFYNTSRTEKTGTRYRVGVCSTQASIDPSSTQVKSCTSTITWTTPDGSAAGTDKVDPITNLAWSHSLLRTDGNLTMDQFTKSVFTWNAAGSTNVAVGNKTAAQLCTYFENGWRLPTQREVLQAYIDGAYWKLTGANTTDAYWSGSSGPTNPIFYKFSDGTTVSTSGPGIYYYVRCVRDAS